MGHLRISCSVDDQFVHHLLLAKIGSRHLHFDNSPLTWEQEVSA
jgi:hypothetical protein